MFEPERASRSPPERLRHQHHRSTHVQTSARTPQHTRPHCSAPAMSYALAAGVSVAVSAAFATPAGSGAGGGHGRRSTRANRAAGGGGGVAGRSTPGGSMTTHHGSRLGGDARALSRRGPAPVARDVKVRSAKAARMHTTRLHENFRRIHRGKGEPAALQLTPLTPHS